MNIDLNAFDLLTDENKSNLTKQINTAFEKKIQSKKFIETVTDSLLEEVMENFYDHFPYDKLAKSLSKLIEVAVLEKLSKVK